MSTMNPMKDASEPLRDRSETFIRVDQVFEKVTNMKRIIITVLAIIGGLAFANLGTSIGANILTRQLALHNDPGLAGPIKMTNPNGRTVATSTNTLEGFVKECDTYQHILDANTISVGFTSPVGIKSVFTAHVSSVVTIPSHQSLCGFYLLVKTTDSQFDIVVSDNTTNVISKGKGEQLMNMVIPTNGLTMESMKVEVDASFKSIDTTPSMPLVSFDASDALVRQEMTHQAATLWAVSMFLQGKIGCNETVSKASIPVIVNDASNNCPISDMQLNGIADFFDSLNLTKVEESIQESCTIYIEDFVAQLERAIPSSCDMQVQYLLSLGGQSSNATNMDRAASMSDALQNALKNPSTQRKLLRSESCVDVASAIPDMNVAIGVGVSCALKKVGSFLSDVFYSDYKFYPLRHSSRYN